MSRRIELHNILCAVLDSENVYFQPPETVKMKYPCVVYQRSKARTIFAGNNPYNYRQCYSVTVIAKDPDSALIEKMVALPMCVFDRHYTADNLNHDVFTIYY